MRCAGGVGRLLGDVAVHRGWLHIVGETCVAAVHAAATNTEGSRRVEAGGEDGVTPQADAEQEGHEGLLTSLLFETAAICNR